MCKKCAEKDIELETALGIIQEYARINDLLQSHIEMLLKLLQPLADISGRIHAVAEEPPVAKQLRKED